MELEDFFYTNPPQSDPHFQSKIYEKEEFKRLAVVDPEKEKKTSDGYFFHQEYVHRYMLNYDFLILIWEAGAGKTIGALGAAERFRQYSKRMKQISYPESYFQPTHIHIRKTIILVKNQNLKSVFKDTLINVMNTGFTKSTDIKNDGFYHIFTYTEFYKYAKEIVARVDTVEELNSSEKERLNAEFRDVMFIIDEAHTFSRAAISLKTTKNKKSKKKTKKSKKKETTLTYADLYQTIKNVIKIAQNIKAMFLTATPMIDRIEEAIYLINLLLAKSDREMPTNKDAYLYAGKRGEELSLDLKMSPQKLAKYFKGIISYTGVRYAGVEIIESGEKLNVNVTDRKIASGRSKKYFESRITRDITYREDLSDIEGLEGENEEGDFLNTSIIVEKCYMSGLQLVAYINEVEGGSDKKKNEDEDEDDDEIIDEKTKKAKSLHVGTRHIRNFVFPDPDNIEAMPLYGNQAIVLYQKKRLIKKKGINIDFGAAFIDRYLPEDKKDKLEELSCTFKRAFEIVEDHLNNKPGVIYIFFDLLISGAMIFESLMRVKFDFERYVHRESVEGLRKPVKRLVYLTGESTNIQITLDQVNTSRNWNGDFIKVVIGSKATSESYSIKNVTTIIQMEPDWNFGRSYQAIRRGIRKDGFDNLKQKVREGVIKGPIPVRIHKLCALIPVDVRSERRAGVSKNLVDGTTVDSARYHLGLEKDWKIKRMEHSLRTAAIDCEANRLVNIDPKTKDYSREALYDISNYRCDDVVATSKIKKERRGKEKLSNIPPQVYDTKSSWVLLYSDEHYTEVKEMILEELRNKGIVRTADLIDKVETIVKDENVAATVIANILKNQVVGKDRYGFNKYVRESNSYIYLSDYLLDQQENYNEIIYSSNLTFSYTRKLGDYFDRIIRKEIIDNIPKWSPTKYKSEFESGGLIQKTIIFEDALRRFALVIDSGGGLKDLAPKYDTLLRELDDYYIAINRPISRIDHVSDRMFDRMPGEKHRGQRPQNKLNSELYWLLDDIGDDWTKIKEKDKQKPKIGQLIYIHYAIIFTASAPAAGRGVKRFRDRLRILEPPYKEWKTVDSENNPVEQQTYENMVADHLLVLEDAYKEDIISVTTVGRKKEYGPGWYFGLEQYSDRPLTKPQDKLWSAVYLTENPFTKKVRIMAPEWFREKYSVKKAKAKSGIDKRKEASGRELRTGFGLKELKIIYLYFRPEDRDIKYSKETYENDIIVIMKDLGLITKMHN